MTRYAAFLRAINVGGHRKIKMADLREQLAPLGFGGVDTFIQSGNVLFDAQSTDMSDLEHHIEAQLAEAFGFDVPTFVRQAADLVTLITATPFGAAADHVDATVYIAFLREAPAPERMEQLQPYQSAIDTLHLAGPHLYWLRRRDLGESAITNDRLEKALGVESTVRSTSTLRKMVDKFALSSPDQQVP
jgi:uncharacterized protein (DUF1697 family)